MKKHLFLSISLLLSVHFSVQGAQSISDFVKRQLEMSKITEKKEVVPNLEGAKPVEEKSDEVVTPRKPRWRLNPLVKDLTGEQIKDKELFFKILIDKKPGHKGVDSSVLIGDVFNTDDAEVDAQPLYIPKTKQDNDRQIEQQKVFVTTSIVAAATATALIPLKSPSRVVRVLERTALFSALSTTSYVLALKEAHSTRKPRMVVDGKEYSLFFCPESSEDLMRGFVATTVTPATAVACAKLFRHVRK